MEEPWTVDRKEAIRLTGLPPDIFREMEKLGVIPKPLACPTSNRKRPVVRYHREALREALNGLARRRNNVANDRNLLDEGLGE